MLDQLVRYDPLIAVIERLPGGSLLDVGSGSAGIAPWLRGRWSVTAVDRDFTDYGLSPPPAGNGVRHVDADARSLPFEDSSFDVAVCVDVLEHIAPGDRDGVLAELARVTRGTVIVGVPTGAAALEADRRLAGHARRRTEVPVWLAEHLDNGFPDPDEVRTWMGSLGPVELIGNESVRTHERLVRFELTRLGRYVSSGASQFLRPLLREGARTRRWLSPPLRALLRGGDRPPVYRTIAVVQRAVPPAAGGGAP